MACKIGTGPVLSPCIKAEHGIPPQGIDSSKLAHYKSMALLLLNAFLSVLLFEPLISGIEVLCILYVFQIKTENVHIF